MRSGNGKHRRPRQAPAIVVAAGVTGAGIALPLLAASGAGAADTATWDRVADCESGGVWSANNGNGFYGGLGLSLDAWQLYGGTDHAPRPDLASRAQQIAIAELILADRGPVAWSGCAQTAGLDEDGKVPDINPGDTSDPSDTGRAGHRDDEGAATPTPRPDDASSAKPTPDAKPSPDATSSPDAGAPDDGQPGGAEPSEVPRGGADRDRSEGSPAGRDTADRERPSDGASRGAERPGGVRGDAGSDVRDGGERAGGGRHAGGSDEARDAGAGTGKHRGEPRPETGTDGLDGDERRPEGRHADRGERAHEHAGGPSGSAQSEHEVRSGDTLSAIAEQHETPGGWPALYEANEKVVGADPDLILPGQKLDLGAPAER